MAKIYWAGQSCFQISVSTSKDHSADIVIDPFDEKQLGPNSYNLRLDRDLLVYENHILDMKKENKALRP